MSSLGVSPSWHMALGLESINPQAELQLGLARWTKLASWARSQNL